MGTFPERLRLLRKRLHLTQSEVAAKIGVAKSTISMYENGNREPDLDMLKKLADFYQVNIDYLVGRSDEGPISSAFDNLMKVYTRRKQDLSREEKMKLAAQILSEDRETADDL